MLADVLRCDAWLLIRYRLAQVESGIRLLGEIYSFVKLKCFYFKNARNQAKPQATNSSQMPKAPSSAKA